MRLLRLVVAIAVPVGVAVVATTNVLASAVAQSPNPQRAAGLVVGTGYPLAIAARQAAMRRRPLAVVGERAIAAVGVSPLLPDAFVATAVAADTPDLSGALLEQAHALTRRDRLLLAMLAVRAIRGGDRQQAITYFDELYRQSTAIEPSYALLTGWLPDPAVRARLTGIFTAGPSWRSRYLEQLSPPADQVDGIAQLADDLRRRGEPVTHAEIAPVLLRLATGAPDARVAGWRLWRHYAPGDPFRWPDATTASLADQYEWTLAEPVDGEVHWDGSTLAYTAGTADTAVARKLTALPPGSYRVRIAGAAPTVQLSIGCGNQVRTFGDGATITLDGSCPLQDVALVVPAGQGAIRSAGLAPLS